MKRPEPSPDELRRLMAAFASEAPLSSRDRVLAYRALSAYWNRRIDDDKTLARWKSARLQTMARASLVRWLVRNHADHVKPAARLKAALDAVMPQATERNAKASCAPTGASTHLLAMQSSRSRGLPKRADRHSRACWARMKKRSNDCCANCRADRLAKVCPAIFLGARRPLR